MYESKGFLNQEPWLRNCYNSSVLWQPCKISSPLCSFKHELSQSWWYLLKHVSHHYTVRIYLSNIAPLFLHGHLVYFEADDWKQVPPRLWCYHNKHLNFSFSSNRYLSRVKHTQSLPSRCSGLGQKSKQRDSALLTGCGLLVFGWPAWRTE